MSCIYDLDTPHLLVDLDRLEKNISLMAETAQASDVRLRPHTKTHKSPYVASLQRAAGTAGITVAKLGEAELMVAEGFQDVFIANQLVGGIKLNRFLELSRNASVACAADSVEGVLPMAAMASSMCQKANVWIEIDTGLGRAGCRSLEEAIIVARAIESSSWLTCSGIFTHEGHIYGSAPDRVKADAAEAAARMRDIKAELLKNGLPCPMISMGSTPSAAAVAAQDGVDEIRPGVYVYGDRLQVRRGFDRDRCALTVLASVVSIRPDGVAILDAGSKSLASDCPFEDKTYGEVLDQPWLVLKGVSEEHGHLKISEGHGLKVGDKLRIIPNHACTCVNMHDFFAVCRGEQTEAVLPVAARGKIQ
jgi:D-serine deaminase-like pyridoxal phosphate-dependent protein